MKKYSPAFAALSIVAGCGGDPSSGTSQSTPPPPTSNNAFATTAYLKTSVTTSSIGQTVGPSRSGTQAIVDQCNSARSLEYSLPAAVPTEAVMSSLDVGITEKWFDTDKALTTISGNVGDLPDMQRWTEELATAAASGTLPSVPPDCSAVRVQTVKPGTLWRDGVRYTLNYATLKAVGTSGGDTQTPLLDDATFRALPVANFIGQSCRVIPATGNITTTACAWDILPDISYLNWPYMLNGSVPFGAGLMQTIYALDATHGQAIAPTTFDIPAGFTVSMTN